MDNSKLLSRTVLALAGSGLSASELEQVIRLLKAMPTIQITDAVRQIRSLPLVLDDSLYARRQVERTGSSIDVSEAARSIDELLRYECGLTAAQAAAALSRLVEERYQKTPKAIPPYSKNSFLEWVERLLKVIPSSEVMHLAAKLRNELIHGGIVEDSWHLKNPNKGS